MAQCSNALSKSLFLSTQRVASRIDAVSHASPTHHPLASLLRFLSAERVALFVSAAASYPLLGRPSTIASVTGNGCPRASLLLFPSFSLPPTPSLFVPSGCRPVAAFTLSPLLACLRYSADRPKPPCTSSQSASGTPSLIICSLHGLFLGG